MPAMMQIVGPLCVVLDRLTLRIALKPAGLVRFVLENKVNVAAGQPCADRLSEFSNEVLLGIVENRMDRVEAQTVEMKLLEPVQGILDEKVADNASAGLAVEIDSGAPGRLVSFGEEGLGVSVEVIPSRAEMVVDGVEEYH